MVSKLDDQILYTFVINYWHVCFYINFVIILKKSKANPTLNVVDIFMIYKAVMESVAEPMESVTEPMKVVTELMESVTEPAEAVSKSL